MLFKTPEPVITTRRLANSGTYLAVDLRPRPTWQQWRLPVLALAYGAFVGLSAGIMLIGPHAARKADVQARSEYAELVNYCYDQAKQDAQGNMTPDANDMYRCIAVGDDGK